MAKTTPYQKQKLLIEYLLSSSDTYAMCRSILDHSYFLPELRNSIRFINEYYDKYNTTPSPEQISAETEVEFTTQPITKDKIQYCASEIEAFCKEKAVENAIRVLPEMKDKGDYGKILKLMNDVVSISLNKDLGISYFDDPLSRLEEQLVAPPRIPTKYKQLDDLLGGGLARKEMMLLMANSGGGKSIMLANLALNMIEQGLHALYISLELSEEMIAQRYDTMCTGIPSVSWQKHYKEIATGVHQYGEGMGNLTIKRMPSGTNAMAIRSYLKEYELKKGFIPDLLVVDYLDLMSANEKVSADNIWEKDKRAAEQLRDIGEDYNMMIISASQQNRTALDADKIGQEHIAGGISKINTVDWAISILFNASMKNQGEIGFLFVKARSSDAVDKSFYLTWDNKYLRIRNPKTDEEIEQLNITKAIAKKKKIFDIPTKNSMSLEELFDKDL